MSCLDTHIGATYNNEQGDEVFLYPAFEVMEGWNRSLRERAAPYTRWVSENHESIWLTGPIEDEVPGFEWDQHFELTENIEGDFSRIIMRRRPLEVGRITRLRSSPDVDPFGRWNLHLRMSSAMNNYPGLIRQSDGTRVAGGAQEGSNFMEILGGEQVAAMFVWYWGLRKINDLNGVTQDVVYVRVKTMSNEGSVVLFPGSKMHIKLTDQDSDNGWSGFMVDALEISREILNMLDDARVGWAALPAKYVSVVRQTGKVVSKLGGMTDDGYEGQIGVQSHIFGYVTKNSPNGIPMRNSGWGVLGDGLGPSGDFATTQAPFEGLKDGHVFHEASAGALETWKVGHSASISAWTPGSRLVFLRPSRPERHIEGSVSFTTGVGNSNEFSLTVQSNGSATSPEGQWVGESE